MALRELRNVDLDALQHIVVDLYLDLFSKSLRQRLHGGVFPLASQLVTNRPLGLLVRPLQRRALAGEHDDVEAVALFDQLGIHGAHLVERERGRANGRRRLALPSRLEELEVPTIDLGLLVLGFLAGQLAKASEIGLLCAGEQLVCSRTVFDEDVTRTNLAGTIELERIGVVDRLDLLARDDLGLERLVHFLLHELLDHCVAACANNLRAVSVTAPLRLVHEELEANEIVEELLAALGTFEARA